MFGHRALYSDGWIACCRHDRLPWVTAGNSPDFTNDVWELYNIGEDFSQADDLAAQHPEKLRELQDLFFAEAAKYNVLPLDPRFAERLDVTLRPNWFHDRKHMVFHEGMVRLPEGSGPRTNNVSHTITALVTVPDDGVEGVIFCVGGDPGGYSLYVMDDKLVYHYNWMDFERYELVSDRSVPTGDHELTLDFKHLGSHMGPADVQLLVDGEQVAGARLPKQVIIRFGIESYDVGVDKMSPVSKSYRDKRGFPFTGTIHSVTLDLGDDGHTPTPQERLDEMIKLD